MRGVLLLSGLLIGLQTIPTPALAFDAKDLDTLRETGSCEGCDLRGADLSGRNLLGANLRGAYMHRANLRGAKLRNADLSSADLSSANLREADLRDAILTGTQLNNSNLAMTNLRGANIRDAELSEPVAIDTAPANDPITPEAAKAGQPDEHSSGIELYTVPSMSSDSIYELDFQPAGHGDSGDVKEIDEPNDLLRFFGRFLAR